MTCRPRPQPYGRDEVADAVAAMMAADRAGRRPLRRLRHHRRADPGRRQRLRRRQRPGRAGDATGTASTSTQLTARTFRDGTLIAEGLQRRAARPSAGRAGLARQPALAAGAGARGRHVRQPGHDHAGAVGRRAVAVADRGRGAGCRLGQGGVILRPHIFAGLSTDDHRGVRSRTSEGNSARCSPT